MSRYSIHAIQLTVSLSHLSTFIDTLCYVIGVYSLPNHPDKAIWVAMFNAIVGHSYSARPHPQLLVCFIESTDSLQMQLLFLPIGIYVRFEGGQCRCGSHQPVTDNFPDK